MRSLASIKRMSPVTVVDAIDRAFASPRFGPAIPYSRDDEEQIFFIVGCGRSGNTLLRNLICQSWDVCIPPEIPGLGNTIRRFARARRGQWPVVVDAVIAEFVLNADVDRTFPATGFTYNLNSELGLDYARLRRELIGLPAEQQSLAAIVLAVYRQYAEAAGCAGARLGDKTPWNAFHIERIHRTFPSARFIHMLRDPRATVASYTSNFNGIRNVSVDEASSRWVDSNRKIEGFARKHPGAVLQARYEDLVRDGGATLRAIAGFLSLQPLAAARPIVHGDENLPHYSKSFKPVATDSLDKWKSALAPRQVATIEASCRRLMRRYHYA